MTEIFRSEKYNDNVNLKWFARQNGIHKSMEDNLLATALLIQEIIRPTNLS